MKTDISGCSNAEICCQIDLWIHSERDRAMLRRRLVDGIGIERLADEFSLSVSQTKRILKRAITELNNH